MTDKYGRDEECHKERIKRHIRVKKLKKNMGEDNFLKHEILCTFNALLNDCCILNHCIFASTSELTECVGMMYIMENLC